MFHFAPSNQNLVSWALLDTQRQDIPRNSSQISLHYAHGIEIVLEKENERWRSRQAPSRRNAVMLLYLVQPHE